MNFKLKIISIGSMFSFLSPLGLAKDVEPKSKVVDLNQIDLEQVDDNWDNPTAVSPVNLNNGPKIKDIVEPTSEYSYASFGKPDPFQEPNFDTGKDLAPETTDADAPAGMGRGMGSGFKEIAISSPLQAYPIDALTIKGVWQLASGEMRAVVLTPKNEGIVIKNGDPMSSGKVLQIEKESVIVRLYRLRKDGVREYEDKRVIFASETRLAKAGSIKLEPGKEAQFPGMESPASEVKDDKAFPPPPSGAAPGGAAAAAKGGNPLVPNSKAGAAAVPVAAAPGAANGVLPVAAPAAAAPQPAGTPPGWPYNMTPPAPVVPSSNRPGSSSK
ncbi:MAG: hypothetical protein EOP07_07270 [Proteobacteria bacterium]|nr:MAG: hypothetical protein EOP07_07270 [Pseudomonadota bacterium]